MQLSGNTILITGGGSGIGRGLAEAFHKAGSKVIIAGRRQSALDEVTSANPGIESLGLDIENPAAIVSFAKELTAKYPALNGVVHNAGISRPEDLKASGDLADAEAMVTTNVLGPARLNAALMPHLLQQERAAILTVSSGLAFTPLAMYPMYCATKAALHSWTQSLRYQLKDTAVEVIEIIPPYVQTELGGQRQAQDPRAMPLNDFISETVALLQKPGATEIAVERVLPLKDAGTTGNYDAFFQQFNDGFSNANH